MPPRQQRPPAAAANARTSTAANSRRELAAPSAEDATNSEMPGPRAPVGVAGAKSNNFQQENSRREVPSEPDVTVQETGQVRRLAEIPLQLIDPDPHQVRQENDVTSPAFQEMCANVSAYGILQPLLVRPGTIPGRYTLIAGEFRYHAAQAAGLEVLPCQIEETPLSQTELYLRQISENLHRSALAHLDLARAFAWLTGQDEGAGRLTAKELARRLGKSAAFICEHKMLLQLSEEEQGALENGSLSFDEARQRLRQQSTRRRKMPRATTVAEAPLPGGTHGEKPGGEQVADQPKVMETEVERPVSRASGPQCYPSYTGHYPETGLTVQVSGSATAEPELDAVIRVLERHLHFLKLKQRRQASESSR